MKSDKIMPLQKFPKWTRILWFILIGLFAINMFRLFAPADAVDVPYSDFKEKVSQGKISAIRLTSSEAEPSS